MRQLIRLAFIIILMCHAIPSIVAQSSVEEDSLRLWVKYEGKWGLIDGNEQWIVEPVYANCRSVFADKAIVTFLEDSAVAKGEVRRHAVINDKGQTELEFMAIDAQFLESFETIVFTTKSGKGCMNMKGEILVEPVYEDVWEDVSDSSRLFVKVNSKWGLMDALKGLLVPTEYKHIETAYIDRYIVESDEGYGLINERNKKLIPTDFLWMRPDFNNTSTFYSTTYYNRAWGYRDGIGSLYNSSTGDRMMQTSLMVEPLHTDRIDYIPFLDDTSSGFMLLDEGKKLLLDTYYTTLSYFNEGRSVVSKKTDFSIKDSPFRNQAFGVIDTLGRVLVEPKYGFIQPYSHGRAIVSHEGYFGVIDLNGNWIVPLEYDFISGFDSYGIASVRKDGKIGLINKVARLMVPLEYESVEFFENLYLVKLGESFYLYNSKGERLYKKSLQEFKFPHTHRVYFQ